MVGFLFNMFVEKIGQAFIKIKSYLSSIPKWLIRLLEGMVAVIAILGFLESQGFKIIQRVGSAIKLVTDFLQLSDVPLLIWLALPILVYYLYRERKKLSLVAGEFTDDFKEGLGKWEFGKDGWKIEHEEGRPLLSVSNSREGGISKKGFSWSDYEVSFDTKVIKNSSGWIIRAESRSKCLMLQLNMEKEDKPLLRLHIKIPKGTNYTWYVVQEDRFNLSKRISLLEWIKVKMIVNGSNIDVYLNGEHAAHYVIADPLKIPSEETVFLREIGDKSKVVKETTALIARKHISMNYSVGKIGFRCAPPSEHAHFRNVGVKPLI